MDQRFLYHGHYSLNLLFFLEAFLIHFCHFILGPLIILVAILNPFSYPRLFVNMGFYSLNGANLVAHMFWFGNVMTIICIFFFEYKTFDYGVAILALLILVLRSLTIAAKYGTFTSEQRSQFTSKILTKKEKDAFLMLNYWSEQDVVSSETELSRAINRLHLDNSTLMVNFFTQPSEKALKEIQKFQNLKFVKNQENARDTSFGKYIDCKSILLYLSKEHEKGKKDWIFMLCLALSWLWVCSPGLGRKTLGASFMATREYESISFGIITVVYTLMMLISMLFFVTAFFDFGRMAFFMNQLS